MNKSHFRRNKHKKVKNIALICFLISVVFLGVFLAGLPNSINVQTITEGYSLNVKF